MAAIQRQQQQQDLVRARQAHAEAQLHREGLVEQFSRRRQQLQQLKADERDLHRSQRACQQLDTAIVQFHTCSTISMLLNAGI